MHFCIGVGIKSSYPSWSVWYGRVVAQTLDGMKCLSQAKTLGNRLLVLGTSGWFALCESLLPPPPYNVWWSTMCGSVLTLVSLAYMCQLGYHQCCSRYAPQCIGQLSVPRPAMMQMTVASQSATITFMLISCQNKIEEASNGVTLSAESRNTNLTTGARFKHWEEQRGNT